MTNISFFHGVDKTLLSQVSLTCRKHVKGEMVHNHGDICSSMLIVISGSLIAYSLSQNGSENTVFTFKKDSIIGANLIFGKENHYPMNIYCTENCELLYIKKSDVELLLHDYQFVINFVKSISLNSQSMNKKIAMYTQKTLRENILEYLYTLSAKQSSMEVTLPMTKKQLADYFGVQRPSLFRELKKLKDEGIIDIHNKNITLYISILILPSLISTILSAFSAILLS